MKVIFLHGLGQDSSSWKEVINNLPQVSCLSLNLFDNGKLSQRWLDLEKLVLTELNEIEEDVVLVGLSLGAMLGLSLITRPLPKVKGLIAVAGQYKLKNNFAYRLQFNIFRLLPRVIFKKMGQDKQDLLVVKAYYEGEKLIGFSYVLTNDKYAFIFHLAVNGKIRGCGYGSQILGLLKTFYMDKEIVLNIEPLNETTGNAQQREKRLTFYKNNGIFETGYQIIQGGLSFLVLSQSGNLKANLLHRLLYE